MVREGSVKALYRRPNVRMSFVEGFEARYFGNCCRKAVRSRRIVKDCDPSR